MDRGAGWATAHRTVGSQDHKESDTTEATHMHTHTHTLVTKLDTS